MKQLLEAIRRSWCHETRAPGDYSPDENDDPVGNPAGQCAVTALLVQNLLGGEIVRGVLTRPPQLVGDGPSAVFLAKNGSHYWNRIPGMGDVDLTLSQFPPWVRVCNDYVADAPAIVPRSRLFEGERARAARTSERYGLLWLRFSDRYRKWNGGLPQSASVVGRRLEPEDTLESTDVYRSSRGFWKHCPWPGLAAPVWDLDVIWIRPEVTP